MLLLLRFFSNFIFFGGLWNYDGQILVLPEGVRAEHFPICLTHKDFFLETKGSGNPQLEHPLIKLLSSKLGMVLNKLIIAMNQAK